MTSTGDVAGDALERYDAVLDPYARTWRDVERLRPLPLGHALELSREVSVPMPTLDIGYRILAVAHP